MNENNEPSYYEIALTNRQVLIAFVVILGSLLVSFLSGVWVGRKDSPPLPQGETQIATLSEEDEPSSQLDSLGFFSDEQEAEGDRPDLSPILGQPDDQKTTLAEDVGSAPPPPQARQTPPPPQKQNPPPPTPPPPTATPPSPPRQSSPPPPTSPPPRQTTPAGSTQEGFVIQVFSTRDEPQARKVLKQLKDGGFRAFMSPVEVDQQAMYRVRVGPFSDREAAEKQAVQVKTTFRLDTWVTAASN